MCDKFSRGNPQEFQHQISSHSETEKIRRASSSSRKNNGKKRVKCIVSYYTTKRFCCIIINVCLPCNYLHFYGFSVLQGLSFRSMKTKIPGSQFLQYINLKSQVFNRSSSSQVLVFVTPPENPSPVLIISLNAPVFLL